MRIKYHKPAEHEYVLDDDISEYQKSIMDMEETKEINLRDKLLEYMDHLDKQYRSVNRIIMHHRLFSALKRTPEFQRMIEYSRTVDHERDYLEFYGVELVPMELGTQSIDDFIIITDSKTVHSDMIEKDFIQDLGVEEALRETNDMIDDREP